MATSAVLSGNRDGRPLWPDGGETVTLKVRTNIQYFKLFLGHINRNLEKLCRAASYVMVGELASQHGPCSNHGVDTILRGLINWVYCWFCPRSELEDFLWVHQFFPLFPKTNISKLQFSQKPGRRRTAGTAMWMCVFIVIYLFTQVQQIFIASSLMAVVERPHLFPFWRGLTENKLFKI